MGEKSPKPDDALGIRLAFDAYEDYRNSYYEITKGNNFRRFRTMRMLLSVNDEDLLDDRILTREGYPSPTEEIKPQTVESEEIVELLRGSLKDKEE